jgi:hypothetical protein
MVFETGGSDPPRSAPTARRGFTMARVVRVGREVIVFCDCPGCPNSAVDDDVDGMNLCAECLIEYYFEKGKLTPKTKYDEDGEPYEED